ncbi:HD domain-containing protein [Candidatus Nanohalobium constans]|uniref:Metal-dependent phosphohydrolase, HD superfamily n=1 Tax=Candidatus Nanohalobium constans TaxID=2565781 RepID=A0A5Q0UFX2_9ARCH|nr:HD domain-containing protein [Candidatus Nanohalobium constans]QGA80533.1 metal-dependent phosphohydrolase, HD superfamily [Candidatus Nanohalobium constans]
MLKDDELEELKSRLNQVFSGYSELAGGKNYRYQHLTTTHKMVLNLEEELDVDVDQKILEIAALYHDIGRSKDIEEGEMDPFEGHEGHDERGAKIVGEYVSEFVTKDQLEKIREIIRNHHSEAEHVEGEIVQDADKLSNFGVSNLWRQIHYAAQHERSFKESLDYFWNTAVDEYQEQIVEMHFEHTKKVAEERLEKQKQVIQRMEKEVDGEDILEIS